MKIILKWPNSLLIISNDFREGESHGKIPAHKVNMYDIFTYIYI